MCTASVFCSFIPFACGCCLTISIYIWHSEVKGNINVCIRRISLDWDLFSTAIYLVAHYLPVWHVFSIIYFELYLAIHSEKWMCHCQRYLTDCHVSPFRLLLCRTLDYKQAINQSPPSRHNPVHWYETGLWTSPCNLHTARLIYIFKWAPEVELNWHVPWLFYL